MVNTLYNAESLKFSEALGAPFLRLNLSPSYWFMLLNLGRLHRKIKNKWIKICSLQEFQLGKIRN